MTLLKKVQFILVATTLLSIVSCGPTDQSMSDPSKVDVVGGDTVFVRDTVLLTDTVFVNDIANSVKKDVSISAERMNVLYMGVDNPITISGNSSDDYELVVRGPVVAKKTGRTSFSVTASAPGECTLSVSELPSSNKTFRIKRIPDPIARYSNSSGGSMGNGEFKAQGGVYASLDNFDFDATCGIAGFTLIYLARRQDPIEVINSGARFNAEARRLVSRAKPGDIFIFDNVRAKCPGDVATRKINSMYFSIK